MSKLLFFRILEQEHRLTMRILQEVVKGKFIQLLLLLIFYSKILNTFSVERHLPHSLIPSIFFNFCDINLSAAYLSLCINTHYKI